MDRDGDGKITIDEFIECLTKPSKQLGSSHAVKTRITNNEHELRKSVNLVLPNNNRNIVQ